MIDGANLSTLGRLDPGDSRPAMGALFRGATPISASIGSGSQILTPGFEVSTAIESQDLAGFSISQQMDSAFCQAIIRLYGQPDTWNYYRKIYLTMLDYTETERTVFAGIAIDSDEERTPADDSFEMTAVGYEWYLSQQKLDDDHLVMLSTISDPADFVRELIGGVLWRTQTGVYPAYIIGVDDWGTSSLPAIDFTDWTTQTTKWEAIRDICEYCHYVFFVRPTYDEYRGGYVPYAYFVPESDLDSWCGSMVEFAYPSPYIDEPMRRVRKGSSRYNRVTIACQDLLGQWYYSTKETAEVTAEEEIPIEYYEENPNLISQQEADDYRDAVWACFRYYASTYTVDIFDRADLKLYQKIKFTGWSEIADAEMRITGIVYKRGPDPMDDKVSVTFTLDSVFTAMRKMKRLKHPDNVDDIEAIVNKLLGKKISEVVTVTGVDEVTGKVTAENEAGVTRTGR